MSENENVSVCVATSPGLVIKVHADRVGQKPPVPQPCGQNIIRPPRRRTRRRKRRRSAHHRPPCSRADQPKSSPPRPARVRPSAHGGHQLRGGRLGQSQAVITVSGPAAAGPCESSRPVTAGRCPAAGTGPGWRRCRRTAPGSCHQRAQVPQTWPGAVRHVQVGVPGLATGKAFSSARWGGRLRVATLSCSWGSVRATTATAVKSPRLTGRCGMPGGM